MLKRVVLVVGVLTAFGLAAGNASAAVESERVASASDATAQHCAGPCPTVIFALGSGHGTIKAWTEWKNGQKTDEVCPVASRGQCTFYVDEGISAQGAYLEVIPGPGVTFKGWTGNCIQSGLICRFPPGEIVTACAKLGTATETIGGSCPPPSVQVYKKGDGTGNVTTTSSAGGSVSCSSSCPSSVQAGWGQGEVLTLTATQSPDSVFVRWDGCPAVQPDGTCRFTLNVGVVICSVFTKIGSPAPSDTTCPYTTPPIVKPPTPPKAVPPRLGSKCTIPGSPFGETINGTARSDVLCGRGGSDRLYGRANHDLLLGGGGNDKLYGHAGNDRLRGEGGNDVLYGGPGTDILEGGAGNDVIHARGDRAKDKITCGRGRDTVYADKIDQVARDCEVVRRR